MSKQRTFVNYYLTCFEYGTPFPMLIEGKETKGMELSISNNIYYWVNYKIIIVYSQKDNNFNRFLNCIMLGWVFLY